MNFSHKMLLKPTNELMYMVNVIANVLHLSDSKLI